VEEGGVFVDFFGVPAPISNAAALLADKTEVPIVLAFCRREDGGRYTVYAQEPLMPESFKGLSADVVTQRIASRIEEEIRRRPDQWLWMYKRWKRRMPGFDVRRYPSYADC
jgi:KDO2-lipid IV(A) lauroyltransferase